MNQLVESIEPRWQAAPLCCRYVVVYFDAQPIQVRELGVARDQTVHWALGVLAAGLWELLGVWLEPVLGATGMVVAFEDLHERGVEKIRLVAANDATALRQGLRATFPDATVLPRLGSLLHHSLANVAPRDRAPAAKVLGALRDADTAQAARTALAKLLVSPLAAKYPLIVERWQAALEQLAPLRALSPRLRRLVLAGDDAAQQLHHGARRAVSRHGCFANGEAGSAILAKALNRAERGSIGRAACIQAGAVAVAGMRATGA